jgi:hypothetical protein
MLGGKGKGGRVGQRESPSGTEVSPCLRVANLQKIFFFHNKRVYIYIAFYLYVLFLFIYIYSVYFLDTKKLFILYSYILPRFRTTPLLITVNITMCTIFHYHSRAFSPLRAGSALRPCAPRSVIPYRRDPGSNPGNDRPRGLGPSMVAAREAC